MRGLKDILQLRLEAEKQASALPALMMEAEKIAASLMHGEHAKRKTGIGQKFWQFRDYMPGDRPQEIDWRQSAKSDSIFIRQKELQTTQKTYIWCASSKGMRYASDKALKTKQDCAIILALSLALLLVRAEEQIGVFGDTKTGRSERRLEHLTQILMGETRNENLPPLEHFVLPHHSALIQIGDFLAPLEEIEQTFSKLAATAETSLIIQILDPAELNLDFEGRVLFEGNAPQETEMINHVSSVRTQYQERIQTHINGVEALCRARNWHYILHRTDTDLSETMNTLWMISSKEGTKPW